MLHRRGSRLGSRLSETSDKPRDPTEDQPAEPSTEVSEIERLRARVEEVLSADASGSQESNTGHDDSVELADDFGMFARMNEAFRNIHAILDQQMRNQGKVGYASQNHMSDLTKAMIEAAFRGDSEEVARLDSEINDLRVNLETASLPEDLAEAAPEGYDGAKSRYDGALAESGNRFTRTVHQEATEAHLFALIWPVIAGWQDQVHRLPTWKERGGNIQAYLHAYVDLVSELSKARTDFIDQMIRTDSATSDEMLAVTERFLVIAESIVIRLNQERHLPAYVSSNAYGRWATLSNRMRGLSNLLGAVRREHSSHRLTQKMMRER